MVRLAEQQEIPEAVPLLHGHGLIKPGRSLIQPADMGDMSIRPPPAIDAPHDPRPAARLVALPAAQHEQRLPGACRVTMPVALHGTARPARVRSIWRRSSYAPGTTFPGGDQASRRARPRLLGMILTGTAGCSPPLPRSWGLRRPAARPGGEIAGHGSWGGRPAGCNADFFWAADPGCGPAGYACRRCRYRWTCRPGRSSRTILADR